MHRILMLTLVSAGFVAIATGSALAGPPDPNCGYTALGCCIGNDGSLYEVAVCETCDTTYHLVFRTHCLHPYS